jgi:hypothetical protein
MSFWGAVPILSSAMGRHLIQGNLFSKSNLLGWFLRVWFRADNSQVCADQLLGSQPDSITVKSFPLCLFLSITRQDLPTKKWNPVWKGVSLRSGFTFIWHSVKSQHLCVGVLLPASPFKKVAGFGDSSIGTVRSSFSSKTASYFRILESVRHLPTSGLRLS